jgi:hypothetical protein
VSEVASTVVSEAAGPDMSEAASTERMVPVATVQETSNEQHDVDDTAKAGVS